MNKKEKAKALRRRLGVSKTQMIDTAGSDRVVKSSLKPFKQRWA